MNNNDLRFDALMPPEMASKAEAAGVAKANIPLPAVFVLAVLAGAFIALGAVFATTVSTGSNLGFGITKLLAGLSFSLGLILVVVAGAELFTGNNLIVIAVASRRVGVGRLFQNWLVVYFGNFVGAATTAAMVFLAGSYSQADGAVGTTALKIANSKCDLPFLEAFFSGILCNVLVCLAVWLCMSARTVVDKILAIVLPIAAFVAVGFEHSVANMYFIPEGLLIQQWAPDSFWQLSEHSPDAFDSLSLSGFVDNLLPVTLGNIVGGALLVGLVYWFVYIHYPMRENSRNGTAGNP